MEKIIRPITLMVWVLERVKKRPKMREKNVKKILVLF